MGGYLHVSSQEYSSDSVHNGKSDARELNIDGLQQRSSNQRLVWTSLPCPVGRGIDPTNISFERLYLWTAKFNAAEYLKGRDHFGDEECFFFCGRATVHGALASFTIARHCLLGHLRCVCPSCSR
jgi:hypothetical protein